MVGSASNRISVRTVLLELELQPIAPPGLGNVSPIVSQKCCFTNNSVINAVI